MKSSLRQFDRTPIVRIPTSASTRVVSNRTGFTMIELLIAVAILVILTTLTVSAFNVNDADRVSNSIGTFKNALEGARSRAINSGEVRGLRLIADLNENRMVKSMVYIGSAEPDTGIGGINYESVNQRWVFRNNVTNDSLAWGQLIDRDLIATGGRIEIPANSGHWYTIVQPIKNYNMTSNEVVILAGHYRPSQPSGTNSYTAIPATDISYRLELEPTTLDGADPILLDPQTCIDMDGSVVPVGWRPGQVADAYGVDSRPMSTSPTTSMDILFSPDGTITGNLRSQGSLHFRFAYVSDVLLAETLGARPLSQSGSNTTPVIPSDPEKVHKALSLSTQTGSVIISEINAPGNTDNGQFNNQTVPAATAYRFAIKGRESY